MRGWGAATIGVLVLLAAAIAASVILAAPGPSRHASASRGFSGRYGIIQRTLRLAGQGSVDPWEIPVAVALRSPSGQVTRISAFYYGPGIWKFRFSPPQPGEWRWRATARMPSGSSTLTGTFTTQTEKTSGFVHRSPYNRYLWTTESGGPYYPLGFETCLVDSYHTGGPFVFGLDGGMRPDGGRPTTPGGRQSLLGAGGRLVNLDTFIRTYARAGFNLYRWTIDNCSFGLYNSISPTGNVYNAAEGKLGDELVEALHRNGVRVYMTFFGFDPPRDNSPADMAAIHRYESYVVARYGAYVDYWELANEATMSSAWYNGVVSYLRAIDPYHHPISTSYPPAKLSQFDINSPHWYATENELSSDQDAAQRFAQWKQAGKPVIVGEQGNANVDWDPRSAIRMRLRVWATFFSQGSLIFWDESAFQDNRSDGDADIWLGPTERTYASVLSHFTDGFDPRAVITKPRLTARSRVRGYELTGPRELGLYLVAYTNHSSPTRGAAVTISPRFSGTAAWINPSTGGTAGTVKVKAGTNVLRVPAFTTDIALKATP